MPTPPPSIIPYTPLLVNRYIVLYIIRSYTLLTLE
ncbi:hypothetical protein PI27_gp096 [Listeria phage WIL-1]|nr:hypothetical protein PI27_gp096 [Listeria phage WIL-1]